jgi:hypothetical protein
MAAVHRVLLSTFLGRGRGRRGRIVGAAITGFLVRRYWWVLRVFGIIVR